MMRLHCVTTVTGFDCWNRILNDAGSHHAVATPKKAATGHPHRNADGQQQTHHFVREEHPARSLLPARKRHKRYKQAPAFIRQSFVPFVAHFRNGSLVSLKQIGRNIDMSIDKNKIKTQDELDEPAPMDQAEQRAEEEMKRLEQQAKKDVAEGLRNQDAGEDEEHNGT